MARYFEIREKVGAWSLEKEEEVLLIDAYDKLKNKMTPDFNWTEDFETAFFTNGLAVLITTLTKLNINLRRHKIPEIEFRETEVSIYARDVQRETRAAVRREIWAELKNKKADERRFVVEHAAALVAAFPPPHRTWSEYIDLRTARDRDNGLRSDEISRRQAAVDALVVRSASDPQPEIFMAAVPQPQIEPPPKPKLPPLPLAMATKMLAATASVELHGRIISRIATEDLVELLEADLSQDLKDQIIERLLEA